MSIRTWDCELGHANAIAVAQYLADVWCSLDTRVLELMECDTGAGTSLWRLADVKRNRAGGPLLHLFSMAGFPAAAALFQTFHLAAAASSMLLDALWSLPARRVSID